jgi:hypothetical protein
VIGDENAVVSHPFVEADGVFRGRFSALADGRRVAVGFVQEHFSLPGHKVNPVYASAPEKQIPFLQIARNPDL